MRILAVVAVVAWLHLYPAAPRADLPVVKTQDYVMSGAVRPLLFWMGRDNIGLARIVWRSGANGARGYDLLVGTDPDRAPRGINRWGLISEQSAAGGGSLLALMTGSNETTYEAEASTVGKGAGDFHVIRGSTVGRTATWQLLRVRTPDALTLHQAPDVLAVVGRRAASAPEQTRVLPDDLRTGFLMTVAEMLDRAVARATAGSFDTSAAPVRYIFGSHTYEMRLRSARPVASSYAGRTVPAVRTRFDTKALDTGDLSSFDLVTATTGDLAGVPLLIEWQPRWWLRVRLELATVPQLGL